MGLMHITGEHNGPPVKPGVAFTDMSTGMFTHGAILAALLYRGRTGKGQWLDCCLSDSQLATLSNVGSSELISNFTWNSTRWGTSHPSIVPYRAFETKDSFFLIGGGNDRLYKVVCERLGHPEWGVDKRFESNALRVANRDVLEAEIEKLTKTRTTQEWEDIFTGSGVPHAKIK